MVKLISMSLWLTFVTASASFAQDANEPSTAHFRTQAAKRGPIVDTVFATGTLQPEEIVEVGAVVAGRIEKFGADADKKSPIDFNSRVEPGTILAQLDAASYRIGLERAKAQVNVARANFRVEQAHLALVEREQERARKLLNTQAISKEELDKITGQCEVARARVEASKEVIEETQVALKEAEINLDHTTIRSPVAGVIIDRRVNVGQTVVASVAAPSLFLIAKDLKRLQVWASVPEPDIGRIRPGLRVRFHVDAYPNDKFTGKVASLRLNATLTKNVVMYTVVIDPDNAAGKLLPYLTADVAIVVAERNDALLVPNAALRWQPHAEQVSADVRKALAEITRPDPTAKTGDKRLTGIVWLASKGFVKPVKLKLGLNDGTMTEVVEGDLREGDLVVVGQSVSLPAAQDKTPKLQALLTERLATLREVSRLAGLRFKNNEGFEDLREANRLLLEAELELCDSAKDRVGVLEKSLIQAKRFERSAEQLAKTGQGRTGAALMFMADRLQMEITLERTKAKMAAQPK